MAFPITTVIDTKSCIGCGTCASVCPTRSLSLADGKARVTGQTSLHCGHCSAACPTGSVTVPGVDPLAFELATVEVRKPWLATGRFDAADLVHLMRSRRSCRSFTDDPIPMPVLEDLVKIGTTAPSAGNCQLWSFTVLPNRNAVEKLVQEMARFFQRLNDLASRRSARLFSKLFMKDLLGTYYRETYELAKEAIREWQQTGCERLFHGAPALILIGSEPGACCPVEDALLACQNILLAAHAMGLGTCLVGFAVEAFEHGPHLKQFLGIPKSEQIHAVIALGKPREKYKRPAGRKKVEPRFFRG